MLVEKSNFNFVLDKLREHKYFAVDTETYGLGWDDRLFSVIVSTEMDNYYFNFKPYPDKAYSVVLSGEHLHELFNLINSVCLTLFMHNAKYDMRRLALEGINISSRVVCTEVAARIARNDYRKYTLDECGRRIGFRKDDTVNKWINKKINKAKTFYTIPGKKNRIANKHYDKVPLDMIRKYGELDGKITYNLGTYLLKDISRKNLNPVLSMEAELTRTCFKMETDGIKLDRKKVQECFDYHVAKQLDYKKKFRELTGDEYKASSNVLKPIFDEFGLPYGTTAKGNASFDKDSLENIDHPIANIIKEIKNQDKKVSTYYSSYLYYMGDDDVIHPNMKQAGAKTGRFSYSNPNLQNVPKRNEDEGDVKVRSCFVPREGYCFVMIDFDQQEYRMMFDYAGEYDVIKRINDGEDVHQVTADMLGISRDQAKTVNFGLLYGMGPEALGSMLKVSVEKAELLIQAYFSKLHGVKKLIRDVINNGKRRGYIYNWIGRRSYCDDKNYGYKLPNALIQGGCADVIKIAMNNLAIKLNDKKSRMVLQVHDEILFEIHETELDIVPELKELMESVYVPRNGMKLTCSVEHSWDNWADKVEGYPSGTSNNV